MSGIHLIWFKRDLRVHDHAPLLAAVASGAPVIPLFIFEPGYWALPEHSRRQFDFLIESLRPLCAQQAE
jgi:deoxyribodipyrimidine photo-lyase